MALLNSTLAPLQATAPFMPHAVSPTQHFSTSIKFIPDFATATHAHVTLPASKTDPFQKGVTIIIAAVPGLPTCPIVALKCLFCELPCTDDTPLFEQADGGAMPYGYFVKAIRDALSLAGLSPECYAGHSFRRGAALAGYLDYEIQLLSQWRSNSYKLYIKNEPPRILTSLLWLESSGSSLSREGNLALENFSDSKKYHFLFAKHTTELRIRLFPVTRSFLNLLPITHPTTLASQLDRIELISLSPSHCSIGHLYLRT
ncbi:hypothetical protein E4T56_gene15215 [Termitomyces sp. T112]|nr:hypothetical protein E4T56_gene15215 [Termitomyces sp. T112]